MTKHQKTKKFVILKFGGTSVSKKIRWDVIHDMGQVRLKQGLSPIIVCSAVSGVSDLLDGLGHLSLSGNYQQNLQIIIALHQQLIKEMNMEKECQSLLREAGEELERLLQGIYLIQEITPKVQAKIMSWGELLSTKIGSKYLNSKGLNVIWYDARENLICEEYHHPSLWKQYLSAQCSYTHDENLIKKFNNESHQVIITQGFIASNPRGETVLLGRGGSDTSASYFAAKLNSVRCEIWTDVPGMFTANPRMVPEAFLLQKLHYVEAQEIASTGAKVLHPRCIYPLQKNNIPLHIYCTDRPELKGTIIENFKSELIPGVKSISLKKNCFLISIESQRMWQEVGYLADLFSLFKQHGLSVDLISTSETNVTVSLDSYNHTSEDDQIKLKNLLFGLNDDRDQGEATLIGPCAVIGLVGQKIRSILHKLAPVLKVFEEEKVYLMTQAASDLNLTFVVNEDQADRLVSKLHSLLFSHGNDQTESFGPSWQEIFDHHLINKSNQTRTSLSWWIDCQEALLLKANHQDNHHANHRGKIQTPLYLYHEKIIKNNCHQLKQLKSINQIFYAIKANHHPQILQTILNQNMGLECVSQGELEWVLKHFPQIDPKKILFTPNFGHREEYEFALSKNVHLTVDNPTIFEAWPEVFRQKEIILRVDPGKGRGHHQHVLTGGNSSKFGIVAADLLLLKQTLEKNKIKVVGLHAHAGSGIDLVTHWLDMAKLLVHHAEIFPDVRLLNLGGGIPIPYKPGEASFDFQEMDEQILKIKKFYPQFEFWIEPGRYVVGAAGILLVKVNQIKNKAGTTYIGVDAGMNALIRPALYGSYHHIVNLTRWGSPLEILANVVGPICETGDTLGHSRRLPRTEEGDVLLIEAVGAYGAVMSSQYNLRKPAEEVFIKEDDIKLP